MRKLLFFTLSLAIFSAFILSGFLDGEKQVEPQATTTDVLSESASSGVVWRKAATENLELIPNFSEKKTSRMIVEEYDCSLTVNGGFYSPEGEPIGYFVTDYTLLSPYQQNRLFDGILSVNYFGTPRILRKPSEGDRLAIQTGPVLIENAQKIGLNLDNDRPRRRTVAAITGSNELIFLNFYSPDSVYSGPFLAQLADAVLRVSEAENLNIADAINLDGGSASAFVTSGFSLSEVSPVGSFFCAR